MSTQFVAVRQEEVVEQHEFASQWQMLQKNRQELMAEIARVKFELNNICEAQIQLFIEEKNVRTKEAKEVQSHINRLAKTIRDKLLFLKCRRKALTDSKIKKELEKQVRRCKNRMEELKILDDPMGIFVAGMGITASPVLTAHDARIIWENQAPIDEVQKVFLAENATTEKAKQVLEGIHGAIMARIFLIEECRRQSKQCLDETVVKIEEAVTLQRAEEIEWGSFDRAHVAWILQNEPLYRDEVIARYKERFPGGDLSDLEPKTSTITSQATNAPKTRRKKVNSLVPTKTETIEPVGKQWEFFFVLRATHAGQKLPGGKVEFLEELRHLLHKKARCRGADLKSVYRQLVEATLASTQELVIMERVAFGEFKGWKKCKTRKHRFFLDVDKPNKKIRLFLEIKEEAY